jgi:hypothetical protein
MLGYRLQKANQIAWKRFYRQHIVIDEFLWLRHPWTKEEIDKAVGIYRKTGTRCSCWMCRNERQNEGPTMQELRQLVECSDNIDG